MKELLWNYWTRMGYDRSLPWSAVRTHGKWNVCDRRSVVECGPWNILLRSIQGKAPSLNL